MSSCVRPPCRRRQPMMSGRAELRRGAAVPAEPNLDVGRVRSPHHCCSVGQVGEAEPKTALRRDTYMFAVQMADDHCALGFARTGNSYMNSISAILGPARNVVDAGAATIVDDVDRLGLRR